jgi:hypothetical protein
MNIFSLMVVIKSQKKCTKNAVNQRYEKMMPNLFEAKAVTWDE